MGLFLTHETFFLSQQGFSKYHSVLRAADNSLPPEENSLEVYSCENFYTNADENFESQFFGIIVDPHLQIIQNKINHSVFAIMNFQDYKDKFMNENFPYLQNIQKVFEATIAKKINSHEIVLIKKNENNENMIQISDQIKIGKDSKLSAIGLCHFIEIQSASYIHEGDPSFFKIKKLEGKFNRLNSNDYQKMIIFFQNNVLKEEYVEIPISNEQQEKPLIPTTKISIEKFFKRKCCTIL